MTWDVADFGFMFVMWSVMMVAMMLPSATPTILVFARVGEQRAVQNRVRVSPGIFMLGYLIAWTGFSAAATLLNWFLHRSGVLSSMMGQALPLVSGALLIGAGIYQWTPAKHACLVHCRSPIGFLTAHWREGPIGAVQMGIHHGAYCVGCCWLLMGLLFVLGVMNLVWIAALTVFVLLEKVVPKGEWLGRAAGVGLVLWGITLIADPS
ncbi:MAG: DUF2182 domain-containing protein [Gammaproteobacteria bacterium]